MRTLQISAIVAVQALGVVFLSGCNGVDFSLETTRATIGCNTAIHNDLISLPKPPQKVVAAVYKFRDQTGQYKTSAQATTFSTAVTQGATSMLNKALEDSGWFRTIEREGLSNLLNERKIINSTRLQHQAGGGANLPGVSPLLYAGVLIEGGIIAYDTNLITGGFGVRYFGVGGSGKIRKDRVTIYLRLVSVQNGQILKSVSTTKTVLSRQVDFGVYRFVSVKRLLEIETGLSTNEPSSMCVQEAIEKAVHDLIIEGIQDGIWPLKNPEDINHPVIQNYLREKRKTEKMVTFDKKGNLTRVEDIEKSGDVGMPKPDVSEEPEPGIIEGPDIGGVIEEPAPEAVKELGSDDVAVSEPQVQPTVTSETSVSEETLKVEAVERPTIYNFASLKEFVGLNRLGQCPEIMI